MGIINNSTRYSPCGRRRKPLPRKTSRKVKVNHSTPKPDARVEEIRAFNEKYPSWQGDKIAPCTVEDDSYKQEISSKYTIAPAYNKGAYQVISKDSVKDIGK